jgi:hypothetical protein
MMPSARWGHCSRKRARVRTIVINGERILADDNMLHVHLFRAAQGLVGESPGAQSNPDRPRGRPSFALGGGHLFFDFAGRCRPHHQSRLAIAETGRGAPLQQIPRPDLCSLSSSFSFGEHRSAILYEFIFHTELNAHAITKV